MNYPTKYPLVNNYKLKQMITYKKANITTVFMMFMSIILSTNTNAQTIPQQPSPPRLVNDFTNTLSPQEINLLEKKLVRFNDTTSNQITVVLVNSLGNYSPSMFATEIGINWKVGQKEFDCSILFWCK